MSKLKRSDKGNKLTLEIQPDVVSRLTKTRPLDALNELIWNALDADALDVQIQSEYDGIDTLTKIIVKDDGSGFPRSDAMKHYNKYGGSWKQPGDVTKKYSRPLHGSEGRGRFNAFALGRIADWRVVYEDTDGIHKEYTISVSADEIRSAFVTEEKVTKNATGVTLVISEPHKQFEVLTPEKARAPLLEIFARYLLDYRDIVISIDGTSLNASEAYLEKYVTPLRPIEVGGSQYPAELEVIEWKNIDARTLQLASEAGVPLHPVSTKFHVNSDFQFSAYLKSPLVSKLHTEGILDFATDQAFAASINEAKEVIRIAARRRAADKARSIVDKWKNERSYPFEGSATSAMEEMERQVFEIVAVTAAEHIDGFEQGDAKTRTLHLRLLRAAIEKSPRELQVILSEVLKLPIKKQADLAELLRDSSFESIVSASKEVSDRLKTIHGIEQIIFDKDTKKRLKERSQLHQILNDNAWMFGNEYGLSVTDGSLTQALRAHRRHLGDDVSIDEPVKHISQERGIIDLMFSRSIKSHRPGETEHLVVELKAPKVTLGRDDTQQIEGYAFSVASDERFRNANTKWNFWLVSNEIDDFVKIKSKQTSLPRGVIHQSSEPDITIWVKTWAQIFDENRSRLRFFEEQLKHTVDAGDAVKFVCEKYKHFLEGVVEAEDAKDEVQA